MAGRVQVGDLAPDFELPDQRGERVRLSDVVSRASAVVLYFYPKDETTGCTAQACEFRDQHAEFANADAVVIGVSGDGVDSHRRFVEKHRLPFTLLADEGDHVRRSYGVPSTLGLIPGRVTYVIDRERRVRDMFSSQVRAKAHIAHALQVIAELARDKRSLD